MCKDIIMEASLATINDVSNNLPGKLEEMYHMLVEISSELETIKDTMAKNADTSPSKEPQTDLGKDYLAVSFENLIHQELFVVAGAEENKEGKKIKPGERNGLLREALRDVPHTPTIPHSLTASTFTKILEEDTRPTPQGPKHPPSPFLIVANKILKGPVILNVGGKKHEVRWNTLDKYPTSRLGRLCRCVTHKGLSQLCDSYSLELREYFFDRSPRNFDAVLGLYRTGKLHLAAGVCVQDFCEELEYWGLDDLHMEPCCQHSYYRARWLLPQPNTEEEKKDNFGTGFCAPTQRHLWNLFENPHHSMAAKIVAIVSCLFVVVSTLCLIFSTLPAFQQKDGSGETSREEDFFELAEAVFVGWFSFEYVIRFIAAPHKFLFVKGVMNIIDLLGILPYFMSLLISLVTETGTENDEEKYQSEMRRIAQIFRIMRIFRIFKLARHITGLRTLGLTLQHSYKELGLLMLVVIMGMLIFSGLAYVGEKDEAGTMLDSMPTALYWAIITMTSVGYGDIHPVTWFGKLVGSVCAICGVLCISLPIPIIVNNFNKFYEKSKIEEEILLKKTTSSWQDSNKESVDGSMVEKHDSVGLDQKSPLPFTISANSLGGVDNSLGEQPLINNFTETQFNTNKFNPSKLKTFFKN